MFTNFYDSIYYIFFSTNFEKYFLKKYTKHYITETLKIVGPKIKYMSK